MSRRADDVGPTVTPDARTEVRREVDVTDRTVDRPAVQQPVMEVPRTELKHKTSAAAAFALVFGLSALVSWFTGPLAVLFGLLGIILGAVGASKAKREHHVTGRGLAIAGIVLGLLGLLLGAAVTATGIAIANDPQSQNFLSDLYGRFSGIMPSTSEIPNPTS